MLFLMIFVYNHSMQKHGHNDYYWNLTKYMKILKIYDKILSLCNKQRRSKW